MKKAKAQGTIAKEQGYGAVSTFRYCHSERITKFIFQDADADWLHCVVGNRKADTFPAVVKEMKKYDVIAGKIADDATNVTILTYLIGAYGAVGSMEADSLCIGRLIPERLKDQYCFRTDAGFSCLSFVESEAVDIMMQLYDHEEIMRVHDIGVAKDAAIQTAVEIWQEIGLNFMDTVEKIEKIFLCPMKWRRRKSGSIGRSDHCFCKRYRAQ